MSHFKLIGKCAGCKKKRWFVRTRELTIVPTREATALKARSRTLLCGTCARAIKAIVNAKTQ